MFQRARYRSAIYVENLARGSRMSGFGSETRLTLMDGVREKQ